jgi:Mrp family chromosome partitioning ATPase
LKRNIEQWESRSERDQESGEIEEFMSRNFELLHEAGKVQDMLRQRVQDFTVPVASETFVPGNPSLPIDPTAREEVTKLVQRLFLSSQRTRQVVFTGTEEGNGCSWICAHAADILASQTAGSVCVVDCDVHYPTLHTEFQVSNHYGLADALVSGEPIRQFAQQLAHPNLWLLSCGAGNENAQQMITVDRMRKRMFELRSEFDYVLLDASPLNASNHAMVLGGWCDGVALVLKANSSSRKAARKSLDELQTANVPVLGAVLNQRTFPIPQSIYNRL